MSKEELVVVIRKLAEELGRSPGRNELVKRGISRKLVARHFGSHREAMKACNLALSPYGRRLGMTELFEDWAGMARELKRLPNYLEYTGKSRYSTRPLKSRFKSWKRVPAAMRQHILEQGLTTEWADVLEMIDRKTESDPVYQAMLEDGLAPKVLWDRPMYGKLVALGPMVCAPTNENGVLFLFGAMAERLGFAFPFWGDGGAAGVSDPARSDWVSGRGSMANGRAGQAAAGEGRSGIPEPQFPGAWSRSQRLRSDCVLGK